MKGWSFSHAALTDSVAEVTVNLQTLWGWKTKNNMSVFFEFENALRAGLCWFLFMYKTTALIV